MRSESSYVTYNTPNAPDVYEALLRGGIPHSDRNITRAASTCRGLIFLSWHAGEIVSVEDLYHLWKPGTLYNGSLTRDDLYLAWGNISRIRQNMPQGWSLYRMGGEDANLYVFDVSRWEGEIFAPLGYRNTPEWLLKSPDFDSLSPIFEAAQYVEVKAPTSNNLLKPLLSKRAYQVLDYFGQQRENGNKEKTIRELAEIFSCMESNVQLALRHVRNFLRDQGETWRISRSDTPYLLKKGERGLSY